MAESASVGTVLHSLHPV